MPGESGEPPVHKFPENPEDRPFIQNIVHTMHAPGMVYGSVTGHEPGRVRVTGRLDRDEVRTWLKNYVAPDCHEAALDRLRAHHVVMLVGQQGLGKHTGALKLLDEVAGQGLVELPPHGPEVLAEYGFKAGHGYLASGYKEAPGGSDADVFWLAVKAKAREEKAFLVVTVNQIPKRRDAGGIPQVVWQAPPTADFLARRTDPETAAQIMERLDGFCTMETLARIAAHEDLEEALAELRASSTEPIRAWFKEPKPRQAVLDLTALSFLPGVSEWTWETLREPLTELLDRHFPAPAVQEEEAEKALPRGRGLLVIDDGLVLRTKVQNQTVLQFASPAYHDEVLAQLTRWYHRPFWNALREWLADVIRSDLVELRAAVAYGLSRLAIDNLEEVLVSYLEPWSRYEQGEAGHETATYLLWMMADDDQLAASALDIAVRWSTSPLDEQRWVSAMVFGGTLGMRYPFEAVRRLWSIAVQGKELTRDAVSALAMLFANLAQQDRDPAAVLRLLELRLDQFARSGADPRLKAITMEAVLQVLTVEEAEGRRPAVATLLIEQPAVSRRIAELLATMLRHRPYRARSMDALAATLKAMKDDERGRRIAHDLIADLACVLPRDEQRRFNDEFVTRLQRRPETATLADVLRAAFTPVHDEDES